MGEDENSSLSEEDLISVAFLEITDNILDEIKARFLTLLQINDEVTVFF